MNRDDRIMKDESGFRGISHRVTHGGELSREPALIEMRWLPQSAASYLRTTSQPVQSSRFGLPEPGPGCSQVAVFGTAFTRPCRPARSVVQSPMIGLPGTMSGGTVFTALPTSMYQERRPGTSGSHLKLCESRSLHLGDGVAPQPVAEA